MRPQEFPKEVPRGPVGSGGASPSLAPPPGACVRKGRSLLRRSSGARSGPGGKFLKSQSATRRVASSNRCIFTMYRGHLEERKNALNKQQ